MTVNLHATGNYEKTSFVAEPLDGYTHDFILRMKTASAGEDTGDVTVFLTPATGVALMAALAGHLGMLVIEKQHVEAVRKFFSGEVETL